MKIIISVRIMDNENKIDEFGGTYDIDPTEANAKGLITRMRTIIRRELIGRGMIAPDPEDVTRKR